MTPDVRLIWHGGRSRETKLIGRDGHNVLDSLYVQSIEFKGSADDGELILRVSVGSMEVSGSAVEIEKIP